MRSRLPHTHQRATENVRVRSAPVMTFGKVRTHSHIGQLLSGLHIEDAIRAIDERPHCVHRDAQVRCDLAVPLPCPKEAHDLALAMGKTLRGTQRMAAPCSPDSCGTFVK